MATDEKTLKSIKPKDRKRLEELGLPPNEIGLVYSNWYESYVASLEQEGRRFPATATEVAYEAFGREKDRQHLYKNKLISSRLADDYERIGREARSRKKTREASLEERTDQFDSQNSDLQVKIDQLMEERSHLGKQIEFLEKELEGARLLRWEERAAIDHLFGTGRRVLL